MNFEYVERIYYLHQQHIKLRNIIHHQDDIAVSYREHLKKQKRTYKYDDKKSDRFDKAFGCYDDKILFVGKYEKRSRFFIFAFDKNLELIKKEYDIEDDKKTSHDFLAGLIKITHGIDSVKDKYGLLDLPHDFTKTLHWSDKDVLAHDSNFQSYSIIGCYDKYADTLVCFERKADMIWLFIWKKCDDWVLLKKNIFIDMMKHAITYIYAFHLECTRHNIILHLSTYIRKASQSKIYIIDKKTLKKVDQFDGEKPTFLDDYDKWREESLELLKGINVLERMSVDLLRVILGYIG